MSDSVRPHRRQPTRLPVPGILQARTLEWVAISFFNARKWKVKVKSLSHVRLLATPWTAAYQVPPSVGFSRQEYWSGVPLPSPNSLLSHLFSFNWKYIWSFKDFFFLGKWLKGLNNKLILLQNKNLYYESDYMKSRSMINNVPIL